LNVHSSTTLHKAFAWQKHGKPRQNYQLRPQHQVCDMFPTSINLLLVVRRPLGLHAVLAKLFDISGRSVGRLLAVVGPGAGMPPYRIRHLGRCSDDARRCAESSQYTISHQPRGRVVTPYSRGLLLRRVVPRGQLRQMRTQTFIFPTSVALCSHHSPRFTPSAFALSAGQPRQLDSFQLSATAAQQVCVRRRS